MHAHWYIMCLVKKKYFDPFFYLLVSCQIRCRSYIMNLLVILLTEEWTAVGHMNPGRVTNPSSLYFFLYTWWVYIILCQVFMLNKLYKLNIIWKTPSSNKKWYIIRITQSSILFDVWKWDAAKEEIIRCFLLWKQSKSRNLAKNIVIKTLIISLL